MRGYVGSGDLQEHGIRTGDIVLVSEQPPGSAKKRELKDLESKGGKGVVTRVGRQGVWVALDGEGDEVVGGKRIWVCKLANDVTFKRYVICLEQSCEKSRDDGDGREVEDG